MKRRVLGAGLMAAGFFMGGCGTLSRSGNVGVSVTDMRPLQASLLETTMAFTLRFTNEGTQPLTLVGSSHRLYLNGSYVGRAVSNERVTIPQLGTTTQTVIVYLENLALVRKVAELPNAPKIDYRLESRLHPEGGFGGIKASATGELDLTGLAIAPAPSVRER